MAVCIGDLSNNAGYLYKCALFGISCLGDGHFGVICFVKGNVNVGKFNDPRTLYFLCAVVVLKCAVEQHLIALNGSFAHLGIADRAVSAVCAVNLDLTGLVLNDHRAVRGVLYSLNSTANIVTLGGKVAGLAAKLESLCNGDLVNGLCNSLEADKSSRLDLPLAAFSDDGTADNDVIKLIRLFRHVLVAVSVLVGERLNRDLAALVGKDHLTGLVIDKLFNSTLGVEDLGGGNTVGSILTVSVIEIESVKLYE